MTELQGNKEFILITLLLEIHKNAGDEQTTNYIWINPIVTSVFKV